MHSARLSALLTPRLLPQVYVVRGFPGARGSKLSDVINGVKRCMTAEALEDGETDYMGCTALPPSMEEFLSQCAAQLRAHLGSELLRPVRGMASLGLPDGVYMFDECEEGNVVIRQGAAIGEHGSELLRVGSCVCTCELGSAAACPCAQRRGPCASIHSTARRRLRAKWKVPVRLVTTPMRGDCGVVPRRCWQATPR